MDDFVGDEGNFKVYAFLLDRFGSEVRL